MQASLVALVAALAGIILERAGGGTPYLSIIGNALIMGAFIIAITAFLLFMRFLPMVCAFEVKAVKPEADPHHTPEGGHGHAPSKEAALPAH